MKVGVAHNRDDDSKDKDSLFQLIFSLILGAAAGAFLVFFKSRGRGDGLKNMAFEAVKYWGAEPKTAATQDLNNILAHEEEIREALMHDLKATASESPLKMESFEATQIDDLDIDDDVNIEPVPKKYSFEDHPAVKQAAKKVTCRHRWTKYLEQQEPKPGTELHSLLKRYERLHDKHLRDLSLEEAMTVSLNSRANKVRYLVWIPDESGGLSGQLMSLISSFLLALLTDRVLLVDFPLEIEHVLCDPFPNSSWLLRQELKETLMANIPKALHAVRQRQPVRSALLKLERGNIQDDKHLLSCHGTMKAVFGHIQWLVVQADYSFIETLQSNKQHQHQLSELFTNPHSVFSQLNRYLIHPSNFLWEKITSQYHVHFSDVEPKPLRIVIHPASLTEPEKHIDAIRTIMGMFQHAESSAFVSVYVIPSEYGSECLESTSYWKSHVPIRETISLGSSNSIGPGLSPFVGQWRKMLTDMWMTGFAHHYLIPERIPESAVPGILYRAKLEGTWLLGDQLDSRKFRDPEPLPDWEAIADRVDCSLIKRK